MHSVTVDEAVEILNQMLEADPGTTSHLFAVRFLCSEALAEHSTIQCAPTKLGDIPAPSVGIMGVINGIFGTNKDGLGAIGVKRETDWTVTGFVNNGREVTHDSNTK